MESTDRDLLNRYLAHRDEAAFRTLVVRHLPLVLGVARRVSGSDDLARDVAQEAFLKLARRAALISDHTSLPAWLHRVARHLAIDQMRSEQRRRKRELAVELSPESTMHPKEPAWGALSPVIDELIDSLPEADREMVLARFYRNEPHAVIANRLGVSEPLARKRTSRALEKLRALLGRRGIATSSSALAALLPAHAATIPTPAALASSIASAAGGVSPLAPGLFQKILLTMNTSQKTIVAAAAALFAASLGYSLTAPENATMAVVAKPVALVAPPPEASRARPAPEPRMPATVDGRLARLRQIQAIPNAAERRREMLVYIGDLQAGQFAETVAFLRQRNAGPDTGKVLELIFGAWGQVDPLQALEVAFFDTEKYSVLGSWALKDRDAALAWAREWSKPSQWGDSVLSIYATLGRDDLSVALKEIGQIPDLDQRQMVLQALKAEMQRQEQPAVLERLVAQISDPADRRQMVAEAIRAPGESQAAVARLLSVHPELEDIDGQDWLFGQWAVGELQGVKGFLEEQPADAFRDRAAAYAAQGLSQRDPLQALELAGKYPAGFDDKGLERLFLQTISREPAATIEAARRLSPERGEDLLADAIHGFLGGSDEAVLRGWIDQRPAIPPSLREKLLKGKTPAPAKN